MEELRRIAKTSRVISAQIGGDLVGLSPERGFNKAETLAYDDLVDAGRSPRHDTWGLYRIEGREDVVRRRDVLLFTLNV